MDEEFTHKIPTATHTLNTLMQICPGPYIDIHIYTHTYIYTYLHTNGQLATIHMDTRMYSQQRNYSYIHEY